MNTCENNDGIDIGGAFQALKDAMDPYLKVVDAYVRLRKMDETAGRRAAVKRTLIGVYRRGPTLLEEAMKNDLYDGEVFLEEAENEGSVPNDLLGQAYENLVKAEETCKETLSRIEIVSVDYEDGLTKPSQKDVKLLREIKEYLDKLLDTNSDREISAEVDSSLISLSTQVERTLRWEK